jgi:hypothetical protein
MIGIDRCSGPMCLQGGDAEGRPLEHVVGAVEHQQLARLCGWIGRPILLEDTRRPLGGNPEELRHPALDIGALECEIPIVAAHVVAAFGSRAADHQGDVGGRRRCRLFERVVVENVFRRWSRGQAAPWRRPLEAPASAGAEVPTGRGAPAPRLLRGPSRRSRLPRASPPSCRCRDSGSPPDGKAPPSGALPSGRRPSSHHRIGRRWSRCPDFPRSSLHCHAPIPGRARCRGSRCCRPPQSAHRRPRSSDVRTGLVCD